MQHRCPPDLPGRYDKKKKPHPCHTSTQQWGTRPPGVTSKTIGGISLVDPSKQSAEMFTASRMVTNPLVKLIAEENPSYPPEVHKRADKGQGWHSKPKAITADSNCHPTKANTTQYTTIHSNSRPREGRIKLADYPSCERIRICTPQNRLQRCSMPTLWMATNPNINQLWLWEPLLDRALPVLP